MKKIYFTFASKHEITKPNLLRRCTMKISERRYRYDRSNISVIFIYIYRKSQTSYRHTFAFGQS